ncbi:MAG: FAD:protein FMN transferase [Alistipes sp.]|nr:FAD:protein FMN transferase [Alistipes sp.]
MKKVRFAVVALVALVAAGCAKQSEYITVDGAMLGTTFHIVAQTDKPAALLFGKVMEVDAEAKRSMSIFDPSSQLSRINRGESDSLDVHLLRNIAVAERIHAISGGAYDITVKPLTEAYGFAAGRRVEQPNIDSLLQFVGFDKVRVVDGRLVKSDARVQLDLNSLAKGYTVDLVADLLEREGIENYIVEVGGEIRCRGVNGRGEAWRVGVDAPIEGNDTPGKHRQHIISLCDRSLATSGNYRRFYTDADGRKVVHTINPRTGLSCTSALLSATVVSSKCIEADAMATMFMAMGEAEAISLAAQMRDSVQVYFVLAPRAEGEPFEIFSTLGE